MEEKAAPVLLCDLDGTLIDTIPLILEGFSHTRSHMGLPAISEEAVREHLGTPLEQHLANWFSDPEVLVKATTVYREFIYATHDESVRAFPGVLDALLLCKASGVRLGLVTSKSRAIAERGLQLTGMGDCFEVCLTSGDTIHAKPHPEPLLTALSQMKAEPSHAWYLGDAPVDVQAALAGGLGALVAGWGVGPDVDMTPWSHTWLSHPGEIVGHFGG